MVAVADFNGDGEMERSVTLARCPFITYAVINDGRAPGERSGDGAYIAMQGVE